MHFQYCSCWLVWQSTSVWSVCYQFSLFCYAIGKSKSRGAVQGQSPRSETMALNSLALRFWDCQLSDASTNAPIMSHPPLSASAGYYNSHRASNTYSFEILAALCFFPLRQHILGSSKAVSHLSQVVFYHFHPVSQFLSDLALFVLDWSLSTQSAIG